MVEIIQELYLEKKQDPIHTRGKFLVIWTNKSVFAFSCMGKSIVHPQCMASSLLLCSYTREVERQQCPCPEQTDQPQLPRLCQVWGSFGPTEAHQLFRNSCACSMIYPLHTKGGRTSSCVTVLMVTTQLSESDAVPIHSNGKTLLDFGSRVDL